MRVYSSSRSLKNMDKMELLKFLCGKELWVLCQRVGRAPEYIRVLEVSSYDDYVLCNHVLELEIDDSFVDYDDISIEDILTTEDYYYTRYFDVFEPYDILSTDEIVESLKDSMGTI